MKNSNSVPVKRFSLWFPVLALAVLTLLFARSFQPGYVHFSNDGPLGQQNAAFFQLPGAFTGIWGDLNDIGSNGGSLAPDLGTLLRWLVGPVGASKFFAPFALFILGLGAWTFFRQLKFSPLAAALGGLAVALNSAFFSTACWGVAAQQIAIGFSYFALALIVSNTPETPALTRWIRWALAGLAVGVNVMHGADIGAIFSVFVAAFVLFKTLAEESGSIAAKLGRGVGRVAVIAVFAGFIAIQTVVSLFGTSITGIAGTGQDAESRARQWDFCTQWSEPKVETLGLFVPGLFGYKMDTPNNMEFFQDAYRGGQYWGGTGRDPNIDRFFDKIFQPGDEFTVTINTPDHPGQSVALNIGLDGNINPPLLGQSHVAGLSGLKLKETVDQSYASRKIEASVKLPGGSFMRQTGGGAYVGILVALLAAWAVAQSFRRQNSIFGKNQRRMIWFWFALLVISLPLSFGRFGFLGGYPYRLLYELPGASLIRNPTKFILIFSWAITVLFAYGVQGLGRRCLEASAPNLKSSISQFQSWWNNARGFDRRWTLGCVIAFVGSGLAWLVYASQKSALIIYLQAVEVPGDPKEIADFSIGQAGWFLLLFALAIGIVILIMSGIFSGKRARLGGLLLGAVLLVDLGRANLPWLAYWDYKQKYASNPIVDILRDKPYEHRVVDLRSSSPFEQLYGIEWVQQLFPYYNIQSLDLVMRPRVGSDLELYESILQPSSEDKTYLLTRHWQLTNVRYLLGPAAFLDSLNQQLDPAQRRFRIADRFDLIPKPEVAVPGGISPEQFVNYLPPDLITARPSANGPYALFEFTGALPRARLYSNWQVPMNDRIAVSGLTKTNLGAGGWAFLQQAGTNDFLTLNELVSPAFDPWQTVLLAETPAVPNPPATATNENPGTVEFTSYAPKDIKFHTQAATPTVLLLNDMFDPHWRVTVDGKPAPLLRANFIMRGVYLTAGEHNVEFQFSLPVKPLYVTLSAMAVGILLSGILVFLTRKPKTLETIKSA